MVENIIIAIIVACCAFYVGRKFYKQLKGGKLSCGHGCTGCDGGQNKLKITPKGAGNNNNDCNCSQD